MSDVIEKLGRAEQIVFSEMRHVAILGGSPSLNLETMANIHDAIYTARTEILALRAREAKLREAWLNYEDKNLLGKCADLSEASASWKVLAGELKSLAESESK